MHSTKLKGCESDEKGMFVNWKNGRSGLHQTIINEGEDTDGWKLDAGRCYWSLAMHTGTRDGWSGPSGPKSLTPRLDMLNHSIPCTKGMEVFVLHQARVLIE
jgi:hypothetical protein